MSIFKYTNGNMSLISMGVCIGTYTILEIINRHGELDESERQELQRRMSEDIQELAGVPAEDVASMIEVIIKKLETTLDERT